MSARPFIRMQDVHFAYDVPGMAPIAALRGINLEIEQGEYVALIGPNGSGKSTLARHLNALLLPGAGDVWVKGINIKERAHLWEIRRAVGMVFQDPDDQIVSTVVEEEVAFGPENLGLSVEELAERVRWALEVVSLSSERQRAPHLLSVGQRQRLAIAGALAMRPECLVLDEATAMLDPAGRKDVLEVARRLNRQGVTIVLITHFMAEAAQADRVIVMSAGQIVMDGPPREIFTRAEELRAFEMDVPPVTELARKRAGRRPVFPAYWLSLDALVAAGERSRGGHDALWKCVAPLSRVALSRENGAKDEALIRVKDLRHAYLRGTPLETVSLRGVNMEVGQGELVGLIGPTGSGKSTLLQHLNGLLLPQEGQVWIFGQALGARDVNLRAVRQKVGLVFQRPEDQLFERYVGDDVAYGPRQLGLPLEEVRRRVREAMEAIGLDFAAFKDRPIFALSGGERRKVALAGVLALEPDVLALDEPTAGLAPGPRRELLALLARWLDEKGKAIVMASHNMDDLASLADRLYLLAGGEIVLAGPSRWFFSQGETLESFGLELPQVAAVMRALQERGWPLSLSALTVPESAAEIEILLRGVGII
ncbi:MAG: energy-coupling factor transporter ATPase [Anaerolineae bacterium]